MTWSAYDGAQWPAPLAFGQNEYDWLAVEVRGERRFAVLVWISRTGPRAARTEVAQVSEPLSSDLAGVAGWLTRPGFTSETRPLFLFALYDLDSPERAPRVFETEIEHRDFDPRTFSATTSDGTLSLKQWNNEGRFQARVMAKLPGIELDLLLLAEKPMITFGPAGSPRVVQGPIVTAWAHRPRLSASARLHLDEEAPLVLTGEGCQDRQWLSVRPALVKWLWLQLRWRDGRELVGYVVREAKSGNESFEEGAVLAREAWEIDTNGRKRRVEPFHLRSLPEHDRTEGGRCPTRFIVELDDTRLRLAHAIPAPFIPLKAFGAMLKGGMWTGPAIGDFDGYAWLDVMSTAITGPG